MKIIILTTVGAGLEIEESEFEGSPLEEIIRKMTSAINNEEIFRINRYGLNGKYIVGWEIDYEKDPDSVSER